MKEYVIVEEMRPERIAKLIIAREQYEAMTDEQLINAIDQYLLFAGVRARAVVVNKDLQIKFREEGYDAICEQYPQNQDWREITILIVNTKKQTKKYNVVDTDKMMGIDLSDFF